MKINYKILFAFVLFSSANSFAIVDVPESSLHGSESMAKSYSKKINKSSYIKFNALIDEPSLADPRVKTIISYTSINASSVIIKYNNANERFVNKLKELLSKNGSSNIKTLPLDIDDIGSNYVYVFLD